MRNLLGDHRWPSAGWWPERLAAVLAVAGVLVAALEGYNVREWQDSGSDFKTLYASTRCFLSGLRAYTFPDITKIFHQYGVVTPGSWYAHSPVYPPFTFAALAPLTVVPMTAAVYLWLGLSALALVVAIWSMGEMSKRSFGLQRGWRLLLAAAVAASPMVSFGLEVGNVSMIAGALCIIAVMSEETIHPNWLAAALTASLMLKPHIGFWLLLGMFLSRIRSDRRLALRTSAFFAAMLVCFFAWSAVHVQMGVQLRDYAEMVRTEIASGSLNPRNHELLPPVAEITSLESLLGFLIEPPWLQALTGAVLLAITSGLVYASRSVALARSDTRLELLGAWSALGLLATYHRTPDAVILFVLLPWALSRLSRKVYDPCAWGTLLLLTAVQLGSFPPTFDWVSTVFGLHRFSAFLVFRQSALSMLLLTVLLLADLVLQARRDKSTTMGRLEPYSVAREWRTESVA